MANLPNILIVQTDQHAANTIGCYGDPLARTENLDRLAAGGVRFTRCVSNNPVCAPFRATMQTGLYSHSHGVVHNLLPLDPRIPTLASILNREGYTTCYAGKWHLSRRSRARDLASRNVPRTHRGGWQKWFGFERPLGHYSQFRHIDGDVVGVSRGWELDWLVTLAVDFMASAKSPWALYLSPNAPHPPPQCPGEFLGLYKQDSIIPPSPHLIPDDVLPVYRKMMHRYYGQVSAIDRAIGKLMVFLESTDQTRNTIVLYTSDHGDRLGHHFKRLKRGIQSLRGKGGPFHSEFHIPLIIYWPDRIRARVCDVLIDSVDLLPTILGLAGIAPLGYFQGMRMDGWCLRGKGPKKEAVYLEHGMCRGMWRGIWDGRFVYSPTLRIMYDHADDPHELNNLFGATGCAADRGRLHSQLISLGKGARDEMIARILPRI